MAVRIWFADTERMDAAAAALICERFCRINETQPIRYRQPADRLQHQAGLVMAAELLGIPEALPLTVSRGAFGKPYFKEHPAFHFNISHSGRFFVCAVDELPVGADIQEPTCLPPESWHLFMTDDEIRYCSSPEQALRLWSAKEAVSKCTGAGFLRTVPRSAGSVPLEKCAGYSTKTLSCLYGSSDLRRIISCLRHFIQRKRRMFINLILFRD